MRAGGLLQEVTRPSKLSRWWQWEKSLDKKKKKSTELILETGTAIQLFQHSHMSAWTNYSLSCLLLFLPTALAPLHVSFCLPRTWQLQVQVVAMTPVWGKRELTQVCLVWSNRSASLHKAGSYRSCFWLKMAVTAVLHAHSTPMRLGTFSPGLDWCMVSSLLRLNASLTGFCA